MSTTLYKSLSGRVVFLAAFFSLLFGVENGLAKSVYALRILKCTLVGDAYPILSADASKRPYLYYYYTGDRPSYYEAFSFLQDLHYIQSGAPNYSEDWVPYGTYPLNTAGYRKYPFFYRAYSPILAGSVPDDWTDEDIQGINDSYAGLSPAQKNAISGTFVAGNSTSGDTSTKFLQFNTATVGTSAYNNGVYTYDNAGNVVVSFPDNTGYASGYKPNPDGTFTPVYYTVDDGVVTEYSDITPPSYDTLSVDPDSGNYSLSIPNYNKQLDKIINKLDTINFDGVTIQVPPPEVTVNPDINVTPQVTVNPIVTVPAPEVTVNVSPPEVVVNPTVTAPDVTVNVDSPNLSDIEQSLVEIGNTLVADDHSLLLSTNDLSLTSEEQSSLNSLRQWETDIPLLGDAVDFGLNSLLGKIPNIGTEYVWMDYTLGGSKRNTKVASSNYLDGYRIRIDLTSYRDTLLAIRGWLILLEAMYFILLIYRNVREALKV